MPEPNDGADPRGRAQALPSLCSAASIAIGVAVLVGWATDLEVLKCVVPGLIAMKPNAALGFVLAGVALGRLREGRRSRAAIGLAAAAAAIGALTLVEYASGIDLGIDQVLAHEPAGMTGALVPGRMHPTTALDFTLLGAAMILVAAGRGYRTAHALALAAMLVAGSALIGYIYGVRLFIRLAAYNQMALHTAMGMLVLSVGVLTARPGRGLMAAITADTAGGLMARRLLPVAILLPFTLDGLVLLSDRARWFDVRFATAIRVIATIAIFVGVIVRLAHSLGRLEWERRGADRALRLLADAMPQLAWMARPDGHISWYNRRWYDYTGTTPREMEGWGWQSVHDPAGLPIVLERWKRSIASGASFEMIFPLRGADGQFRQFLTRVEASRGEDGRILHWFGTNTDIQDQKRAEEGLRLAREELERRVSERTGELALANEELHRGEQQFRTMANSIPQLAWMARPDGHRFWYNRRWYDYTGTTPEQVEGWGWQSVHDPAELPRVLETIKESFASGDPWDCTFPIRRHDGAFRWHLTRMLPVKDEAGRVMLWFGTNTDITEHKELESSLREAKEAAEAAARAKGEFLANMSHEIRTPMNGILGMTELTLNTDLTSSQREYLGLVKSSADALLTVIDDILDFSKIEAGKLALDPIPFSVRDAATDTLRALALRAHDKGLELACRIAPEVPETLVGDPGRLRQVLINLVGNALKFTERGEVFVAIEAGAPGGPGREVRVSVADTGIGIPAEKRAAIFAPFEQADGSTTRKYGGTGLGLAISGRLVALMGGRIWVEDNPGGGSIFRFTVRLADDTDARPRPCPTFGTPPPIAGRRVLIVDDNRTNRLILEELLKQWGCRVGSAIGGDVALEALHEAASAGRAFEVVLLDLMMPGMDGCTLAGRIRDDPALAGLPMLMLTSGGADGSGRFRDLGIGGWLAKPIRHSELFNALVDLLHPRGERIEAAVAPARPAPGRPGRRLRVLLAEDHPINQKVARRMLEDQGHEVTIVGDGRAAVAAAGSTDYDVILMDVQMPEMDGFEATAAIREAERPSGRRVPIVALTAHAMTGDRERCLAAGCDDYLSKPVASARLRDALGRLNGPRADPPQGTGHASQAPDFDPRAALESLGGDQALLVELLELFFDDSPRLIDEVRSAVRGGDLAAILRLSHTVAGVAGNFAARGVDEAARRLHAMARAGELAGAAGACEDLVAAVGRFRLAVDEALAVPATGPET